MKQSKHFLQLKGSGVSPDKTELRQDLETTPTGVDFTPTRRELTSTHLDFTPTKQDFPPSNLIALDYKKVESIILIYGKTK